MPTAQEIVGYSALGLLIAAAGGVVLRAIFRKRPTPAELEKRRRESIHRLGKLGDGEVLDVGETAIVYTYMVRGVEYTASQDFAGLESLVPTERMRLIGPASIKFMVRNPANSIVLCEEWSGLRLHGQNPADETKTA
jgi:hypothetical protein